MPRMKLILRLLAAVIVLFLIGAFWLWWNRPKKTDMADYAPADALVYLESNSLLDVAETLGKAEVWKALNPDLQPNLKAWPNHWWKYILAWTGIGPTPNVILARAQVAAVV